MSTFVIRGWIDVPEDWSARIGSVVGAVDPPAELGDSPLRRVSFAGPTPRIADADRVASVVAEVDGSRAVVAEHHGSRGGTTTVIVHTQGSGTVVYRHHVLGAHPRDPQALAAALAEWVTDPRDRDVTGPAAAVQVAERFGVDPATTVAADADETAWSRLDSPLGAFPMVRALITGLDP